MYNYLIIFCFTLFYSSVFYPRNSIAGDRVFPLKGTYNTLNMSLRHVARHAGLSFNPTIHLARHTFATTITLSQGMPIETVSCLLGHTNIKTTQIYAKITNEKISRDMSTGYGGIKRETQQRLQGRTVMASYLTANSIPDLTSSIAG